MTQKPPPALPRGLVVVRQPVVHVAARAGEPPDLELVGEDVAAERLQAGIQQHLRERPLARGAVEDRPAPRLTHRPEREPECPRGGSDGVRGLGDVRHRWILKLAVHHCLDRAASPEP